MNLNQAKHSAAFFYSSVFGALLLTLFSGVLANWSASEHVSQYLGTTVVMQYTLIAFCMLFAWYSFNENSSRQLIFLLGVAVLARLFLLTVDPYTSNDVTRYLFDGKIALEGFDPYRIAHDAPVLAELKNIWQPPEEHAAYVTLYPPLALGLFSFAASFGVESAVLVWKVMVTFASIAILLIGFHLLQYYKLNKHLPLLALSPILILETGEGIHLDAFSALAILCAMYFWNHQKLLAVGTVIGIGALVKFLPLVLLGPMFLLVKNWRDRVKLISGFLLVVGMGYAISFYLGLSPIGSVGVFFEKWRFGSPIYYFFEHIIGANIFSIFIAVSVFFAYAIIAFRAFTYRNDLNSSYVIGLFQATLAVPLLLSPVIFPWYLMSLCVLVCLRPSPFILFWSIVLPTTYVVLNLFLCCDQWEPAIWPMQLLLAVFIISGALNFLGFGNRCMQKAIFQSFTKRTQKYV